MTLGSVEPTRCLCRRPFDFTRARTSILPVIQIRRSTPMIPTDLDELDRCSVARTALLPELFLRAFSIEEKKSSVSHLFTDLFVHSRESKREEKKRNQLKKENQIDKPKTETMAYIDLFSQLKNKSNRLTSDSGRKTLSLTERYTIHRLYCPRNMNWRYVNQLRSSA